ncbi:MAG: NAD-dependent protein deacylase [Candidatus Hydrogenedentota bacterium]
MDTLDQAAMRLRDSRHAVALTGAGMSAESGIPTFRGKDGIWAKYPPEEYATIEAYLQNPQRVWEFWKTLAHEFQHVKPNSGHTALARLENADRLKAVITQNIDNLHQSAGSRHVIDFHGSMGRLICLKCHRREPFDTKSFDAGPPSCAQCGGLMKPDVVMFGEEISKYALYESHAQTQQCDVMLVIGTSAQVFPAAGLPYQAKQGNAYIIECNIEPTDFTHDISDAFLGGPSGEMLPRLVNYVLGS